MHPNLIQQVENIYNYRLTIMPPTRNNVNHKECRQQSPDNQEKKNDHPKKT